MSRARRDRQGGERGVALVSALIALVVIGTAAADFAYSTQVDLASAINARDDLRAHYLSRSGVNLSKLLLKVQQRLIDANRKFFGGMDLQIADYAPILVSAFNSKEGAEALGSILGVDSSGIKGLGVDTGTFDLELESLDGRLNLNCGGGPNTGSPEVARFAAGLAALMLPARYNRLFEEQDENGQFTDRLEVLRAIIDWADQDMVMFGASNAEDYRYNTGKDPYEIKNHYFDTLDELRLVKGIDDDFMAAFQDSFTVYGGCKVNVNLASAPLLTALLIQHAASPNDQSLQRDNLTMLVRYLIHVRDYIGGFADLNAFLSAVEQPMDAATPAFAGGAVAEGEGKSVRMSMPPVHGLKLNDTTIKEAVVVGGPRRIWRIKATAKVGRIQKQINAVWDTTHIPLQTSRYSTGAGGFLYWREE